MHQHMVSASPGPCACTTLKKASRAISRLYDDALAGTGVGIAQFAILRCLSRNGDMPLSRLAEAMVMDRTSLYRALGPLTRNGWVAITSSEGRTKSAGLRPEGVAAMERAAVPWDAAQSRFLADLGAERWAALQSLLGDVLDAAR
jgi:DNA-binding MarR family transcriptional regulator